MKNGVHEMVSDLGGEAAVEISGAFDADAQRGARELAATTGNHLVDVHVELRATSGHPHA